MTPPSDKYRLFSTPRPPVFNRENTTNADPPRFLSDYDFVSFDEFTHLTEVEGDPCSECPTPPRPPDPQWTLSGFRHPRSYS